MSVFRLIAITLPMTFLIACGGGGGGTAMTETPTTMPPGTGDPVAPPGTGGPATPPVALETLPDYTIADLATTRTRFNGTVPTDMTEAQIVSGIQTIATTADTLIGGDLVAEGQTGTSQNVAVNCPGASCSVTITNVGSVAFSINGIEALSPVDDTNLEGFDSEVRTVMVVDEATLIEGRAAARRANDTRLAFQTYGGWLTGSVFGVDVITVPESGNGTTFLLFPYAFGDASGTNPTGSSRIVWEGVVVGARANGAGLRQGVATVDIDDPSNPDVDVSLTGIKGVGQGSLEEMETWEDITLMGGAFESKDTSRYIKGSFFGSGHTEVGGVFYSSNQDITGAFGATRQ